MGKEIFYILITETIDTQDVLAI